MFFKVEVFSLWEKLSEAKDRYYLVSKTVA